MRSALHEELRGAIDNLETAERKVAKNGVGFELFTEALATLNECVDEYPEHKKIIEKITFSHIRRIIDICKRSQGTASALLSGT